MKKTPPTRCFDIFVTCQAAIKRVELLRRPSAKDKEYHFQNWFEARLKEAKILVDAPGRNSYPDYRLVDTPEGYELKALAFPGRENSFDSNSQVPTGFHNGRTIFYVVGRYPFDKEQPVDEYPLVDFVMCHGDFLNADHTYVHKNDSFRGFGSYGDILVRDRKMYVAPTPFALLDGVTALPTLIVPSEYTIDPRFQAVGRLTRVESNRLVIGYEFDLRKAELHPKFAPNPDAGKKHEFIALRLKGDNRKRVKLVPATVKDVDEDASK